MPRIKTVQQGYLEEKEVKEIIKDYLKANGYEVTNVSFDVKDEADPDDSFGQYPLSPVFKGVHFTAKGKNNE